MINKELKTQLEESFYKYVKEQVNIYIDGYGETEKQNINDNIDAIISESFDTFIEYIKSEVDECLDSIRFEIDSIIELDDIELDEVEDIFLSEPTKQHWILNDAIEKIMEYKDIKDRSDEIQWEEEWSKMDEDFI
jgi:hypothetical protein